MINRRSALPASPRTRYWVLQVPLFYACLLLLGLVLLAGSLVCVVLNWLLPREAGRRFGRWFIGRPFRVFFAVFSLLGLMRVEYSALDQLEHEPGLLIAPNHPSMLDAMFIISRLPQIGCIMKSTLWDNIFLGAGARLARYIRNDSVKSMVRLSVAELQRGGQLLMFPEGTRTVCAPVNPLKGGVALIAQTAQRPIQTVILETNSPYLSKGWSLFRVPAFPMVFRARLGQRFDASQGVDQTLEAMQRHYEQELVSGLAETAHEPH